MKKPDSDGAASHNSTVFIDTSLGTHFAMLLFHSDTVSDLKEKIEKEHLLCFPNIGNIKIHALKVKRKGCFYHLSDSMYLKSVFVGINQSWFLFIDVSSANDTSVDRINLAGSSSQLGQMPNRDALSLRYNVAQQYVNEKAPGDICLGSCQSSERDLTINEPEVTRVVENCSRVQLGTRGSGSEDRTMPTLSKNNKKKRKRSVKKHALEVDDYSIDDNDHHSLQQDVASRENLRDCVFKEDSDLPMAEHQSNADGPCRSLSFNTCNDSEYGLKGKFNLSEETEVPRELDGKNDKLKTAFHLPPNSSLEEAELAGPAAKEMHKIEEINGVKDGQEGNRELVSDSSKVVSNMEVTLDNLSENIQIAKVVLDGLSTEPDRDMEIDETNRSKVEPMLQINKTQAGVENMNEQVRKKLKKRLVTSMKRSSDLQTKGIGKEDSSPSKRSNGEVKSASKEAMKIKLRKVKSRNEIVDTNLDSTRLPEIENSSPSIQTKARIVGSSVIPSHASEGNPEERHLEAKDERNEILHFDNMVKKISRVGVKSLPSSSNKHEHPTPDTDKERVSANAADTSGNSAEKNSEAFAIPRKRSDLKNSKSKVHLDEKHMGHQSTVTERKSSRNENRNVTRSEPKNLLATLGGIFKDASSDGSEDEDGIANSNASSRSPYDSSSSDFSDGEHDDNMKSSENGSIDWKRKGIRGRSIRKTGSPGHENMTLDMILRSSSRYKKAKLTADQLQLEESKIQPVDFVPDSQDNL